MSPDTQIHRLSGDELLSQAVVHTVAAAKGVDPVDLDVRLFDCIDPDALDRLFAASEGSDGQGSVVFTMADCRVEIEGTRRLLVTPARDRTASPEVEA